MSGFLEGQDQEVNHTDIGDKPAQIELTYKETKYVLERIQNCLS